MWYHSWCECYDSTEPGVPAIRPNTYGLCTTPGQAHNITWGLVHVTFRKQVWILCVPNYVWMEIKSAVPLKRDSREGPGHCRVWRRKQELNLSLCRSFHEEMRPGNQQGISHKDTRFCPFRKAISPERSWGRIWDLGNTWAGGNEEALKTEPRIRTWFLTENSLFKWVTDKC